MQCGRCRVDFRKVKEDAILILQRPDGSTQEIALQDSIFGAREIIELIVEGRIRMGGLSVPTEVTLALAPGSEDSAVLPESPEESFSVEVTRTGDGTAGALEVPLGLFEDALGEDVIIEGDVSRNGQRAVVNFDRGEARANHTQLPWLADQKRRHHVDSAQVFFCFSPETGFIRPLEPMG